MTSRQEIYDRIRNSSKDEVILEEMIRLGYWPRGGTLPEDPADEIRELAELEREMRALTSENARLHNAAALKKALRKKRLEESKRKRKENKERRLRERAQRAANWKAKQRSEITYLGPAVSKGLGGTVSDAEKLGKQGLHVVHDAAQLADAMQTSVGYLRFLAFDRKTAKVSHYRRFALQKKTGGLRNISAPMPRLKQSQRWILENVLSRVELHQCAHGFRLGRSIVTNAQPHVGSQVVINLDLQDFFPSISYRRVKGMFRSLGYSEQIATILGLICTEPDTSEVRIDHESYFVSHGERRLPQGAPSSPAITNIICRGLDARLSQIASNHGGVYTRYADDITMSFKDKTVNVGKILRMVEFVVGEESFIVHPKKTRIQRAGSHQEVTGLTVNDRVSVSRKLMRQFRATLFQIEKDGPAGKRWGRGDNVIAAIEGFANFVSMVEPEKGNALKQRVERIIDRHGRGHYEYTQRDRWTPPPIEVEIVQEPASEGSQESDEAGSKSTQSPPEKSPQLPASQGTTSPDPAGPEFDERLQSFSIDTTQTSGQSGQTDASREAQDSQSGDQSSSGSKQWWKFWKR